MASSTQAAGATERPAGQWPSPRTQPEDVFLVWLLGLPEGTDPAEAARIEIARIDAAELADGRLHRLRALFGALARTGGAPA
ncbi:MAG: hypothetical protein M9895_11360 [Aquamicrobium sp.]|uniref:hypothetical protein n=1 Tax=Aquamicrobium sp. TaxID=1872579 RepID=UPI00349E916B|nr:hypothetical protein [Aquamicrobium sp.]